tara:strand:+ start:12620 stop:13336 length:717 start_codon:yes stop_codon:yes gene_type:complete
MTASESKEEFNLRYNNALEGAPGLDVYEISAYLTASQEEIVKQYYDASKSPESSFELKERSRRVLNELVKDEKITSQVSSTRGLVDDSKLYELSNDAMFIVLETVTMDGSVQKVIPTTHDEFMISYRNPFRKPNKNKAWRVDISKENSKTTVELVADREITQYNIRYISNPDPIIVGDLTTDDEVGGLGLSINGKTSVAACKLAELIHREIINRAVELAVIDYREPSLQNKVTGNSRV